MVFTFYSFKGGVGRSMAMATVGYLLAQRGLKVLVIDFDLEAPGLERYFFDEPTQLAEVRSNPGLIDLVRDYKRALTSEAEFQRAAFKNWPAYVVEAIPQMPGGGSVELMTSGQRYPEARYNDYALAVRAFDWQDFFHNWKGDRFFEWLRRELCAPGRGYDAVLVDSRTGVTEMGGVCAYQLADVAVLLCAPNYQNVDGTRAVVTDFRSDAVVAVRRGQPLEILVVPARVEQSDPVKRDRFFDDFERIFGTEGLPKVLADAGLSYRRLAIPYRPELAIIERLVDETAPGQGGALAADSEGRAAYDLLTDALTLLADGERWQSLKSEAIAKLAGHATPTRAESLADTSQRGAGYDAYIEYRHVDNEPVGQLVAALSARQLSIWRDVDQLAVGDDWESTMLRALDYSHALIVAIGCEAPGRGYWPALQKMRARQKPVVPVILPGCTDPPAALERHGLSDVAPVDLREGLSDAGIDEVARAINRARRTANLAAAPDAVAPFPGAAPCSEDQASYFIGRESDLERLLGALDGHHVVLLEGAAGVGKTSLVQAGLLPLVRRAEGVFALKDGESLWAVLTADLGAAGGDEALGHFRATDQGDPTLWVIDGIDSFPEHAGDDVRRARIDRITALVQAAGPRRRILLVWRAALPSAERVDASARWLGPADSGSTPVLLEPLPAASLRSAIEKPAAAVGHLFEPGLVDRLIRDAGNQPGAIAQIQLALADIWAGRKRGWLTNKAYETGGGIAGRFSTRMERVLTEARERFGEAPAVLVTSLVRLDPQLSPMPDATEWPALSGMPDLASNDAVGVRDLLVRERLIDLWLDTQGRLWCGLAQPVPGPMLETLVHAEADFLLWRQRFAAYVHEFVQSGRESTAAVSASVLGEAEHWRAEKNGRLSDDERLLIDRSIAASHEAEVAEQARQRLETERLTHERDRADQESAIANLARRRANTRARWLAVAALFVIGLAAGSTRLWRQSLRQQDQLTLQAELAGARRLGAQDPTEGVAAFVVALQGSPLANEPDLRPAFLQTLYALPGEPLASARLEHPAITSALAFAPDGGVLTVSADPSAPQAPELRFWSFDGKLLAEPLPGNQTQLLAAALTADGRRAITVGVDGHVREFDAAGTLSRDTIADLWDESFAVFSRDARRIITVTRPEKGRVWVQVRNETGVRIAQLYRTSSVTFVASSPDASRLVTSSGDGTRLWNVATRQSQALAGGGGAEDADFSPDGRYIVAWFSTGAIRLWDADGHPLRTISAHAGAVNQVTFSPDSRRIASASNDLTAALWDLDGQLLCRMQGHTRRVGSVEFSPDGSRLVTTSEDKTARVWDTSGTELGVLTGHAETMVGAVFDPTGKRIITTAHDGTARVWRLDDRVTARLQVHTGAILSVEFSRNGAKAVTTSLDHTAVVWDLDAGTHSVLAGHTAEVLYGEFSPDGRYVVTASYDRTARVWDLQQGSARVLTGHTDWVSDARFSPDGQSIVTASADKSARIWTLDGTLRATLTGHHAWVRQASFSPDGRRVITASDDGTARLWDLDGHQITSAPMDKAGRVHAVFSPDGTRVLAAFEQRARLLNRTLGAVSALPDHPAPIVDASFSPDGTRVLTASDDGTARIWTIATRKSVTIKTGAGLRNATFSDDGQLVATVGGDSVARLWSVEGQLLAELKGHSKEVDGARFRPGNGQLMTVSFDASARLWATSAAAFLRRVQGFGLPCLTAPDYQETFLLASATAEERAKPCRAAKGLESGK